MRGSTGKDKGISTWSQRQGGGETKNNMLEEMRQEGTKREGTSRKGILLISEAYLSTEALGCLCDIVLLPASLCVTPCLT